jgi:sigma-B regulation protein RsbU (phosphoserine phosphatase)
LHVSIRWRLVLAIGVPLLVVYAAIVALLVGELRARNLVRLEATVEERVLTLAGWVDDRIETAEGAGDPVRALAGFSDRVVGLRDASSVFLVADREGRIVHDSEGNALVGTTLQEIVEGSGREDVAALFRDASSGGSGIARLPGIRSPEVRWFGYASVPSIGGVVIVTVPESVVTAFSRSQLRYGIALLSAGLVLILIVVFAMGTRIVRPFSRLAEGVRELGTGDLDAKVEGVDRSDELGDLARSFNRMVVDLKHHVEALQQETAAREAIEGELRVGRKIQQALLPKRLPSGPAFDLATKYDPARHVAGDFYDAFPKDGGFVLVVADVSGKGLPSALFMAASKTVLQRALSLTPSLAEAVAATSDALEKEEVGSMYLTAFVGHYEPETGRLRYVNAGHPPPLVRDREGRVSPLGEPTGGPVGLLPGRTFEEREAVVERGSTMIVFTDGVPEARREDGTFYGDERLLAFASGPACGGTAAEVCESLSREIAAFQEGKPADDVTLLALRRL